MFRREYASYLSAIQEPSLSCGGEPDEAYRLLDPGPHHQGPRAVSIRISRSASVYTVVAILAEGVDDAPRLKVTRRIDKRLDAAQWDQFLTAIKHKNPWWTPTFSLQFPIDSTPNDGYPWLLEARSQSMYHVILRGTWEGPAFVRWFRTFFELAGLQPPDELLR